MAKFKPQKAFILAAGKGTRLRPHTDTMPKPMVPVAGISIIHRTLKKLCDAGVGEVVVNTHHLAPVIEDHLRSVTCPKITISREETLLDTGGGVKKMLHFFADDAFFMINGDALWTDQTPENTVFSLLSDLWDDEKMDMLLLLQPIDNMVLTEGVGDYKLNSAGQPLRCPDKTGTHMFAGVRIVHPRLFNDTPDGAFSFLSLMDKAQQNGRLFGLSHQGDWHHISTPEDLARVDEAYRKGQFE